MESTTQRLRVILGYCLIAFSNALVPVLVSSAAYLIVPYTRPVVIAIQTLPAVAAKLALPYVLPRINHWQRLGPLAIALCLLIATYIVDVSPPNVPPWIRVAAVVLASVASAAGDASWLGNLSLYGKAGLKGWAIGGGLGGFASSVLPYTVTIYMGRPLRYGLGYAWWLVPLMLASHYLVLPTPSKGLRNDRNADWMEKEASKHDVESSVHLLQDQTPEPEVAGPRSIRARSLLQPFVLPLMVAFAAQAFAVPGMSRTMAIQPVFETYAKFLSAYFGVFQLGNLTARAAALFDQPAPKRATILALGISSVGVASLAVLPTVTMPMLCFPFVWLLGAAVGALYVKVFDAAVDGQAHESVADREFRLGFIGAGEYLGLLMGGLTGAMLETSLCGRAFERSERWCHMTR